MTPALFAAVLVGAGLLAAWSATAAALGLAPPRRLLQGLLTLQLLLLVQLGVGLWQISGGDGPAETGAYIGYVVMSLLLLPGALALTADERSRYGTLVLGVACLTVAVVEVRMEAVWR